MSLRFRHRVMTLFLLSLASIFCVQWILFSLYHLSFFTASVIAFLAAVPGAYFFVRLLVRPLDRMTDTARLLTPEIGFERIVAGDEIDNLSRTIQEMAHQLRNRIDDLSQEKEYLQAVLKGMLEGVLVVDERGRIRMVNEALQKLLLLPPNVSERLPLEVVRNAQLESSIQAVLEGSMTSAFEMEIAEAGKTIEVNVVPIVARRSDGKARGAIAVFHDISRLKHLEKMRRDFVANVSHELRTPLTTIKGYAETLLEGALKEEIAPQFLQVINRHADRLTQIVEDLLALSKIESKEFQLKTEPIPVSSLVEDALDFVREPADKKEISLVFSDPLSLSLQGDRSYLEQALINLLDNAVKYGREGGKVTISAVETDSEEIRISVADDGIGIPKEDLGRIFERFYRVDKGRSQHLGGTGLGLSIVKHIIQAHGGRVWAESALGKGSTFYFELPKTPRRQSTVKGA